MSKVKIELAISMENGCDTVMSISEAKELYMGLKDFFDSNGMTIGGPAEANVINHGPSVNPHTDPKKMKEPVKKSDSAAVTGSCGNVGVTMPPPNLKVEAARERTAMRTKGCGDRNA